MPSRQDRGGPARHFKKGAIMTKGKGEDPRGGSIHRGERDKTLADSPAAKRQQERENQSSHRGSGEGTSGLERGDGHPTGR